jgi:hypothetical protein
VLASAAAVDAGTSTSACGVAPYSYAGVIGRNATRGVMATVQMTADPQVDRGHVAAWVGVGGVGLGPHGTNQWLQVGFGATDAAPTSLYYELTLPHATPRLITLPGSVHVGTSHRVGVIEMWKRPGWWRVWLDGSPVTRPIRLVASHARWAPVATAESWNGGVDACNGFGYRFTHIRTSLPDGRQVWGPLSDSYLIQAPGYSALRRPAASLVVAGGAVEPPPPADEVTAKTPPVTE